METNLTRYVPQGYTDSFVTPLLIQGLTGLDLIDILHATHIASSVPDIDDPFNDHVPLIRSHIYYFEETGFYQKNTWYFIIYPYITSRLAAYLTKKITL